MKKKVLLNNWYIVYDPIVGYIFHRSLGPSKEIALAFFKYEYPSASSNLDGLEVLEVDVIHKTKNQKRS